MRIVNDTARVRVPASSGNLGPGFDSMGMAHDVWDEVSATLTTGASKVIVVGEGHDTLPKDETHLIIRVMRETFERVMPLAHHDHLRGTRGEGSRDLIPHVVSQAHRVKARA